MINQKAEIESQLLIENRGKLESKKKLKKIRSMKKLQRLSSRGRKPQYDHSLSIISSVGSESSLHQTPIEVTDASPNYMKATSSSHAKDSFQIVQRLVRNKTLTRMSTLKLKRSLTRKLSGKTEEKRKLKSSRSIKLATVKGSKSTAGIDSDSIDGIDGENGKSTSDAGNKLQRVLTRRLSLKPVRISAKKTSCKSKNSSVDSSLHKATCSSAIKDSHFHDRIELPQEESGSQGVSASAVRVCPYTYCSLHGHRHGDLPPLKRFVSMRRRQLKTPKSVKKDGRSKQVGNPRKATQKSKTLHNSHFHNEKNVTRESSPFKPHDNPPSTVNEGDASTKGKNMEPDYEVLQKSFEQDVTTTGVAYEVQERDQKYIKKWHLMYKHAVLSNAGKCENKLPFVGNEKEGREEDNEENISSRHNCSETDSDMDDEKKNVIELVQKAFDEILLPEVEDISSDNHLESRGNETDEQLLGKSEGKIEERNTTTFAESPKEVQNMENKSKNWSRLKRVILLKRFVKALEKVRNINSRRPGPLPSDANFEAEKVFLNHQTAEEKIKTEWMLDYALQKVISKLAPAQKQRVALLIEAFETIRPIQDAENGPQSSATVESPANPIQSLDASSNHSKEEISDGKGFEVTERARIDKNTAAFKKNDESATVESTSTEVVKYPDFDIGVLEEEVTTKGKNMEPDYYVPQKNFVQEEPKHGGSITGLPYEVQERDQKYIKKWHLMYKHAVLSNTSKCENKLPFVGNEKEGREEDNEGNNSLCHSCSETDSDMDDEKKNVIELVQKAFDEILLPETEQISSDDHSKSRSYGSEEVLLEKSEGKVEERNASTFKESPKEAQKMEESKPKSWSHLKKLILLKRFVKALEKVRNINPRRPRQSPSDPDFEAEHVVLNRQTAEERRKSEEWMLDYALQKVISKLAPAQRQRVTLLIEAFETVLPFQDAENRLQSSATVESQENPIESLDASINHGKEQVNKGRDSLYSAKTLLGKVSCSNDSTMEFSDKASENPMHELCNPFEPVEPEEAPTNRIVDEVPEDLVSDLNTENTSISSESPERYCETKNVIGDNSEQFSLTKSLVLNGLVRSLKSNLVGPEAPSNLLDEPTRDRKDMIEKGQPGTSQAPTSAVVESETQVEKQGNTGLWFMVYKHMVSDITENNPKTLTDGPDENESEYEGSITRGNSVSYESTPVNSPDVHFKDHVVADAEVQAEVELRQIEAIKMVEEAIDFILPDRQPLPDDNTIGDSTERMHSQGLNQKEEKMESGNGIAKQQKEEPVSKEGDKPKQKLSRNWSNLKKFIMLRRFIKALEKVRKFNPRGPRYLPLEPDSEAEKVELRRQDMAERKGTEEWMLDYALRQVVSKLTPVRKRKVELLVEAFETVVPTVKN
ncbi:calmodulin binding protein PICBP-like [Vicia villosa]|uniref:calmodulin binding protein PICBP-like n=1 Tax=Vicia villosa TaxID=3911 RepID=UPI00273CAD40|nr:calmodulin binding protein PICBP-like [Vicia villosa]